MSLAPSSGLHCKLGDEERWLLMTKVLAGITTSVDGYITGPDDGPGKGLGEGGERLHYWVFGGPWTYDAESRGEPTGEDAAWLAAAFSGLGAVVGGRGTYEAAGHWGGKNPWDMPFFIVTHRPEEQPEGGSFTFVSGVKEAIQRAVEAAGDKDVHVMGGADVIRQALAGGLVDELTIIVAPVVLGGGKLLFDGFSSSLELEHLGVRQSPFATFIDYRVKRP
jgi:dihydrofolate reductase